MDRTLLTRQLHIVPVKIPLYYSTFKTRMPDCHFAFCFYICSSLFNWV